MKIDSKKGFITVYVILAMLFFVVFVTTASITATRKLKLQKEANTAIFELYDENIEGIVQKEQYTIPIYTQAQFVKIANWLNSGGSDTEYVFINDVAYELTDGKLEDYTFLLRTDLYFNGTSSTENGYPFIPQTTGYHEAFKKMKAKNVEYKQRHKIVLYVEKKDEDGNTITDSNGNKIIEEYLYDDTIKISNAEEFVKIGQCTEENEVLIDGYRATPNATYELESHIELGKFLDEIYSPYENDEHDKYKKLYRDFWENRPNFEGILDGNDKIINGVKIEINDWGFLENINKKNSFGLFTENSGTIQNINLTNITITNSLEQEPGIENFGIITGKNLNNGKIINCTIGKENSQFDYNYIEGNVITAILQEFEGDKVILKKTCVGGIVGNNLGEISGCSVNFLEIKEVPAINQGLITGRNSGKIKNIEIGDCRIKKWITSDSIIGGVAGIISEDTIENIVVNGKIEIVNENEDFIGSIGGIIGSVTDEINNSDIQIKNITIEANIDIKTNEPNGLIEVGGIVGKIDNSCAINGINVKNTDFYGDINGINVKNTDFYGDININGIDFYGGGIVGKSNNEITISNCIINGSISGAIQSAGGICGSIVNGTIEKCWSNVEININSNSSMVYSAGGITGNMYYGNINNCAYVNKIKVEQINDGYGTGGIVGQVYNNQNENELKINNCYMNGVIESTCKYVGALIGNRTFFSIELMRNPPKLSLINNYYNQAFRYIGHDVSLTNLTNTSYPTTSSDLESKINTLKNNIQTTINNSI